MQHPRLTLASVLVLIAPLHATQNAPLEAAPEPGQALTETRVQELVDARLQELLAEQAASAPQTDKLGFKTYWKNGLRFESQDKSTKLQLGGRLYNDWAWFAADRALNERNLPDSNHKNGTEMRSARIYIKGTLDERYFFKANYDFGSTKKGDGGPGFKDVYMGLKEVPTLQNVQVGHFKEPMGLEVLTSSKYTTFMERSLTAGIEPSRNTGMMAFGANSDQSMTYAAGVFRESDKFGSGAGKANGGYAFTARLTGLPLTNDDHTQMIHVGVAASRREVDGGIFRLKGRPESHLAPKYLDTDDIAANAVNLIGLEWASVNGPFYTQAEFVYINVDGKGDDPNPNFSSFYGQASWFITGESKPYSAKSGTFSRVKPTSPWGKGGSGAWELALRYSTADLDHSAAPDGGELSDITLGLNWYLSSYARMMANYVHADLDAAPGKDGQSDIFMLRFQIDF